jgi:hypothetical protein
MTDMTSNAEQLTLQSPVEANRRHMQRLTTSNSVSSEWMTKSLVQIPYLNRFCDLLKFHSCFRPPLQFSWIHKIVFNFPRQESSKAATSYRPNHRTRRLKQAHRFPLALPLHCPATATRCIRYLSMIRSQPCS